MLSKRPELDVKKPNTYLVLNSYLSVFLKQLGKVLFIMWSLIVTAVSSQTLKAIIKKLGDFKDIVFLNSINYDGNFDL